MYVLTVCSGRLRLLFVECRLVCTLVLLSLYWLAMSTRGAKRWHFDVRVNGIFVLKGGRDLKDKSGKEVGPMSDLNVPTTRSACQQAASFLNYAVQVSIAGWGSQHTACRVGLTAYSM